MTATRKEGRDGIIAFLRRRGSLGDHEPIADDADLFELGILDSMGAFALLVFLSERYGMEISEARLDMVASVSAILSLVEQQTRADADIGADNGHE